MIRRSSWPAPFTFIILMVVALLRPLPPSPPLGHSRIVVDAEGTPVPIEIPFKGVVMNWQFGAKEYLGNTHAPETMLNFGGFQNRARFAKDVMSWIYPEVLNRDSLWDESLLGHSHGAFSGLEYLLAHNAGAYLDSGSLFSLTPLMRRVGLPAFGLVHDNKDWDEWLFSVARYETKLIEHPERGEALIAEYRQAFGELARELRPEALANFPRVLIIASSVRDKRSLYVKSTRNSYQIYLPPAGVVNASKGWTGEQQDAERILAMDPDIIFYMGRETIQDFKSDPRWQGLKAVKENLIYKMPGSDPGILAGLHLQPVWVRWMAEIAHPERLQPKLREMLRDHFVRDFGYRLSDAQIDAQLHMNENKDQPRYARFDRGYQIRKGE